MKCTEFVDVLSDARSKGRLGYAVDLQHGYDGRSLADQISFCRENLGADAIQGTWGNWCYHGDHQWSWTPGPIFYFDQEDDAVMFRLRFT